MRVSFGRIDVKGRYHPKYDSKRGFVLGDKSEKDEESYVNPLIAGI
jgi:hypothetical protein